MDPHAILSLFIGIFGATYVALMAIYKEAHSFWQEKEESLRDNINKLKTDYSHGEHLTSAANSYNFFKVLTQVLWWIVFRLPVGLFAFFIFDVALRLHSCEQVADVLGWSEFKWKIKLSTWAFISCIGISLLCLVAIWLINRLSESTLLSAREGEAERQLKPALVQQPPPKPPPPPDTSPPSPPPSPPPTQPSKGIF